MGKARGRKPKYTSVEELQRAIDEYFDSLYAPAIVYNKVLKANEVLIDEETGKQVRMQAHPATMTGLARALDMTREGLASYRKKSDEYADTIMRARERVQEDVETRLYNKDSQKGAEFNLRVNFKWIPADTEKELALRERTVDMQEAKLNGITTNVEEINKGIQSLANMINNPVPNRRIEDFE